MITFKRPVVRLQATSGCKEGARGGTRGSPASNRAFLLAGVG
jgi:hypothetical protein